MKWNKARLAAAPYPQIYCNRDGINKYTEAHHLIPRKFQKEFGFSLDSPANIISLCSNCHNCLHYGAYFEFKSILEKLYYERAERLENVGLYITVEELKKCYL